MYWEHIFMEANKSANVPKGMIFSKSREFRVDEETQKERGKIKNFVWIDKKVWAEPYILMSHEIGAWAQFKGICKRQNYSEVGYTKETF